MKLANVRARVHLVWAALGASRWCKPALRILLAGAALVALAAIGRYFAVDGVRTAAAAPDAPASAGAPAPAPAPNLTQSGGFTPPAQQTTRGATGADPTGDVPSPLSPPRAPTPAPDAHRGPASPDDPVFLNQASLDDLQRLPGIGAKRASAIVALRTKLGRFRQIEDLLRVRGLGRRTLARLKPLVRLDPPPQPDGGT